MGEVVDAGLGIEATRTKVFPAIRLYLFLVKVKVQNHLFPPALIRHVNKVKVLGEITRQYVAQQFFISVIHILCVFEHAKVHIIALTVALNKI